MATPQGRQPHAPVDLATVFAELCTLPEAAGLRLDDLLLQADNAFAVNVSRQACARRDSDVNVPRNRRSTN